MNSPGRAIPHSVDCFDTCWQVSWLAAVYLFGLCSAFPSFDSDTANHLLHTVAEAASLKRIPYYLCKHHQVTRAWFSEPGKCQGSILQIFPHLVSSLICMWQQAIYEANGKWIELGVKVGLIICTFQLIVQPALTSSADFEDYTKSNEPQNKR